MDQHQTYLAIIKQLEEDLKKFGTYNYYDKGPSEVTDVPAHIKKIKELYIQNNNNNEIAELIAKIHDHEHGSELAVEIIIKLTQSNPAVTGIDWAFLENHPELNHIEI